MRTVKGNVSIRGVLVWGLLIIIGALVGARGVKGPRSPETTAAPPLRPRTVRFVVNDGVDLVDFQFLRDNVDLYGRAADGASVQGRVRNQSPYPLVELVLQVALEDCAPVEFCDNPRVIHLPLRRSLQPIVDHGRDPGAAR